MDAGTRTVTGAVTVEIDRVRGSRFVARLAPADSEFAARAVLDTVRAVDSDATHHCWAWRGSTGRERSDDGGEPPGTAGAPILHHLTGANLVDVMLVVTRWFGGTKLGRGGLVRAYGAAAAAAIAAATVVEHVPTTVVRIVHRYADAGAVDAVLHGHATEAVASDYGATVTRMVRVATDRVDALRRELTDATSGRATVVPIVESSAQ